MKSLIIYYSYTGNTRAAARELAAKESADMVEIKDVRPYSRLKAYSLGCIAAIRGKAWPIRTMETDPSAYDRLILMSPVWAGNPPPAFHALLAQLPEGKKIVVKMNSAGGQSNCRERIETAVKAKGGILEGFEDIRVSAVRTADNKKR